MGWSRIELHCHSRYSIDGLPEPADILKRARMLGISAVAVTDHNTMDGYIEAADAGISGVELVPAMEIDTRDGEVLALFIKEPVPRDLSLEETVSAVREQGGLAVCPHPFDRSRKNSCFPDRHDPALWDAIEVLNAASKDVASFERARRFAAEHDIPMLVGSDAHTLAGLGSAVVLFRADSGPVSADAFKDALRSGKLGFEGKVFGRHVRLWEDAAKRAKGAGGFVELFFRTLERRLLL